MEPMILIAIHRINRRKTNIRMFIRIRRPGLRTRRPKSRARHWLIAVFWLWPYFLRPWEVGWPGGIWRILGLRLRKKAKICDRTDQAGRNRQ